MKIFLSPSNQVANIGCYKEYGLNECEQCERIAYYAKEYLSAYDCEVMIAERKDDISKRVSKATEWGANVYIPIHTNAFSDASVWGVETFYNSEDIEGKELAIAFLNSIGALIGKKRSAKIRNNLFETVYPKCTKAYIECDFHTNPERTRWMVENVTEFGYCIAKVLVEFYGISKNEEQQKPIVNNQVTIIPCYKIVIGDETILIETDKINGVIVSE